MEDYVPNKVDTDYWFLVNTSPFFISGVGVDDMFIVLEVWKNLSPEENNLPVPQKIATTLKHAGVSITVTSLTDAVAFGVGASTVRFFFLNLLLYIS